MGAKPRWFFRVSRSLYRIGHDRPLLDFVRVGSDEELALFTRLLDVASVPSPEIEDVSLAARACYDWAKAQTSNLRAADRERVMLEITSIWRTATYGKAARDIRAVFPELAQAMSREDEDLVALAMYTVHNHFSGLLQSMKEADRLAVDAFHQINRTAGPYNRKWKSLFDYLVKHRDTIAPEIEKLKPLLTRLEELSSNPSASKKEIAELNKQIRDSSGFLWKVRGEIGEIYLGGDRRWRRHVERLMADARAAASQLQGGPWDVVHVSGDLWLRSANNPEFSQVWDQAILLVNHDTSHAMLHTAVQMKVEKKVSAFFQTLKDLYRELGRPVGSKEQLVHAMPLPPAVKFTVGGEPKTFTLAKLPGQSSPRRVVVFAKGGRPKQASKVSELDVQAFVTDLRVDQFHAVGLQVMTAIAKMVDSLK